MRHTDPAEPTTPSTIPDPIVASTLAWHRRVKADRPDVLVLHRVGDFYETFDGDAETVARVVGLTLTSRDGVPLVGVAYWALTQTCAALVKAGHRVGVSEPKHGPAVGRNPRNAPKPRGDGAERLLRDIESAA